MTLFQAILLGIVQGLTEFIPISSTAHLVLAMRAMDLALTPEQATASMAVIQLGTLLAVLVYFAGDIWRITRAFIHDHVVILKDGRRDQFNRENEHARLSTDAWLGWLIIIGTIPVVIVGLAFKKQIEGSFTKNLWIIATMMIVVALLLIVAELVGKRKKRLQDLGLGDAVAVGLAQCLALIPGSSRSGSTMMAGLFVGQTRETAARFSFLLSIPAIAASGVLELFEAMNKLPPGSFANLAVGTAVSAVVGYVSIWFLLRFLRTHSTGVFIGYRILVGGAILVMLLTGRLTGL